MEESLLPHHFTETRAQLEEERRLLYVAMTRARQRLVLTHADERAMHGSTFPRTPSRFLAALPEGLVRRSVATPAARPTIRGTYSSFFARRSPPRP